MDGVFDIFCDKYFDFSFGDKVDLYKRKDERASITAAEQKNIAVRKTRKKRKKKPLWLQLVCSDAGIFFGAMLLLYYLIVVPVVNPFRYEWVKVTIKYGETAYELQEKYAPNANKTFLKFQIITKNDHSLSSLEAGDEIYLVKDKTVCEECINRDR